MAQPWPQHLSPLMAAPPTCPSRSQVTLADKVWSFCLVRSHSVSPGALGTGPGVLEEWRSVSSPPSKATPTPQVQPRAC